MNIRSFVLRVVGVSAILCLTACASTVKVNGPSTGSKAEKLLNSSTPKVAETTAWCAELAQIDSDTQAEVNRDSNIGNIVTGLSFANVVGALGSSMISLGGAAVAVTTADGLDPRRYGDSPQGIYDASFEDCMHAYGLTSAS